MDLILPSCLWFLPGPRLTFFYRDASSAFLQLVNQWLNFTYSRSHAFRYGRKNANPTLVRIELTTSALLIAGMHVTYYTTRATNSLAFLPISSSNLFQFHRFLPSPSLRLLLLLVLLLVPPTAFLGALG